MYKMSVHYDHRPVLAKFENRVFSEVFRQLSRSTPGYERSPESGPTQVHVTTTTARQIKPRLFPAPWPTIRQTPVPGRAPAQTTTQSAITAQILAQILPHSRTLVSFALQRAESAPPSRRRPISPPHSPTGPQSAILHAEIQLQTPTGPLGTLGGAVLLQESSRRQLQPLLSASTSTSSPQIS